MSTDPGFDEDDGLPFPLSVRIAAGIWLFTGMVGFLGTLLSLPAIAGPGCLAVVFFGLYAWTFLSVGTRTARGEVRDTLQNGIGSLGIAAVFLGVTALFVTGTVAGPPGLGGWAMPILFIGLFGVSGSLLMMAGVLALIGRGQYRSWRALHRSNNIPPGDKNVKI